MKNSRKISGISSREWQSNSGTPKMNEIRGRPGIFILDFLNYIEYWRNAHAFESLSQIKADNSTQIFSLNLRYGTFSLILNHSLPANSRKHVELKVC